MKKAKIIIALLVVLAVCFGGLAACTKAEYTLSKTTLTLEEGQTQQLTVSSSLDNEFTVEYATSNAAVATVSVSGLVTAVKAGSATITATVDGTELTCNVTVTAKAGPVVYEYKLSKTEVTLEAGNMENLSVTVTPNKTISVTYTSANPEIATVNDNGRVIAIAVGETTITAAVDGKELTCKVTVEKAPPVYDLKAVGTPLVENGKTLIEKGATLKFEVTSSEADDEFTVVWSTSNEAIATIAQDGTVTAVANGDVTVKAKIGEVEKTIAVQVFTYQYTFEQKLTLAYGTTDAKLAVSVDHGKTLDISYVLENEDVIAIDEQGNIEIKGVGTATVTVKDGELEIGECEITVNAVLTAPKALQMHVGDEIEWTITANPVETKIDATFEVVEGDTVVSIGSKDGKVTALANGSAKVKATVGEVELTCDILVDDLNASIEYKDIADDDKEQLSGSNVAYWENYVNNDEINYKAIVSDEEDVIERIWGQGTLDYLPDFVYLIWTDGDSRCAKPSKPNGDFREGALLGVRGQDASVIPQITLNIKVYAGQTTIKLYAGAFKCHNIVTISNGDTEIASYDIQPNGEGQRKSLLTFSVDAKETMTLTIVLTLSQGTADNSFITIGAVSVSGSTYQLEESSKRLAPEGTATIVMKKDGEAITSGVTYQVIEGADYISLDETTGVVTAISLGTAKIAVTAEGRTRIYTVEVGYAYSLDDDKVQLHEGQTHQINVVSDPAGATIVAQYESTDQTIATVSSSGLVTAVANGTVIIKVTVDEKEYELTVVVSDVVAASAITELVKDKNNPIDLTDGAEYWEQYIANGEVNHKQYVTVEEDIIDKTSTVAGNYLSDYPAFISWHGGANGNTCSCGKCNKDSQNGGDGGWNGDAGTKAMAVNVKDAVIALQFKLVAGESVIKIYTGGYNLLGRVQLKLGEQVIGEETFDNRGSKHISHMVAFTVDTVSACEVTAELVMIDDSNNAPHSCISLAAASVSGSVYQLEKASERVAPNGTAQIVLNKNGEALTAGVTYEVVTVEGEAALATVSASGLVTAGETIGTATIKVTADGRVRYFTVEIGYEYEIDQDSVTLTPNATHQINITSSPIGSTATITYTSGDETVATVSASGLITAVGNGSTTITAEVDGKQLTVAVVVSGIEVAVTNENIKGKFVDLTSPEVIYWEHYIWSETNPKALAEGEKDLIDTNISGYNGDPGYGAHMYFTGSRGPKADSFNDGAFHKFSKGALFTINVTVPVGTHEIRVYTGAWANTVNQVSLLDGNDSLASYTIPKTDGGANTLVTFTLTTSEETLLTVELKALEGDNCRLAAVAIADTSIQLPATNVTMQMTKEETNGVENTSINLSEVGTLDWIIYNVQTAGSDDKQTVSKNGGTYITRDVNGNYSNDYRAKFTWGNDGTVSATDCLDEDELGAGYHNNLVWADNSWSTTTKVDSNVKTITMYVTGWNCDYAVVVRDSNGNMIFTEAVESNRNGQSHAYAITFTVEATAEETLTLSLYRAYSEGNLGAAAIAVGGEVA